MEGGSLQRPRIDCRFLLSNRDLDVPWPRCGAQRVPGSLGSPVRGVQWTDQLHGAPLHRRGLRQDQRKASSHDPAQAPLPREVSSGGDSELHMPVLVAGTRLRSHPRVRRSTSSIRRRLPSLEGEPLPALPSRQVPRRKQVQASAYVVGRLSQIHPQTIRCLDGLDAYGG